MFRLIVGDLIPENNDTWSLYLLLLQITEILLLPSLNEECINLLQVLITEHHSKYIELFQENLKPKFHILLHYPNIIRKVGPLVHLSSMRFEAKHYELKSNCNVMRCRKNLPYSLCNRLMLKFCYRVLSQNGLTNTVDYGPTTDFVCIKDLNISTESNTHFCVPWLTFNGIKYKRKCVLLIDEVDTVPHFAQINEILIDEHNNFSFSCEILHTCNFDIHLQAYVVQYSNNFKTFNNLEYVSTSTLHLLVESCLSTLYNDRFFIVIVTV